MGLEAIAYGEIGLQPLMAQGRGEVSWQVADIVNAGGERRVESTDEQCYRVSSGLIHIPWQWMELGRNVSRWKTCVKTFVPRGSSTVEAKR